MSVLYVAEQGAVLSLGYTLLANELQSLLDAIGFDPYLGFYHRVRYGRPSLALDLLEEFRAPLVDRFALFLNNKAMLTPEDFDSPGRRGVRLKPAALKKYLARYEEWMQRPLVDAPTGDNVSAREIFRRQAQRLARTIREDVECLPYRFTA